MKFKLACHGDKRVRSFFAWFPVRVNDEVRWLERVTVEQVYYAVATPFGVSKDWHNRNFLDPLRPDPQPTPPDELVKP